MARSRESEKTVSRVMSGHDEIKEWVCGEVSRFNKIISCER